MNLERFIYEFNLISTLTIIDNKEWAYVLNHNIDTKIDYTHSICLYDFVLFFNKLYLLYREEYEKLTKLNLGEDIEIWEYYSNNKDNEIFRNILLYVWNPKKEICDNYEAFLFLYESNREIHSYITNCLDFWNKDYFRKDNILDEDIIKEYLNFGNKYEALIESYFFLKDKFILGNGCTVLFSKINGNLFDNLSTFEITFGNAYFNSEDYINVVFNLGENLSIDYEASKVVFALNEQDNKKEIIDKLLHTLFINNDKLPDMYKSNKAKKLVR